MLFAGSSMLLGNLNDMRRKAKLTFEEPLDEHLVSSLKPGRGSTEPLGRFGKLAAPCTGGVAQLSELGTQGLDFLTTSQNCVAVSARLLTEFFNAHPARPLAKLLDRDSLRRTTTTQADQQDA